MNDNRQLNTVAMDLSRFDDPLYAEPRIGFGGGAGWITLGIVQGKQSRGEFRLGFAPDIVAVFASEDDARACARELVAVFERYGVKATVEANNER